MKYDLKHKLKAIRLYELYARYDYPPGVDKASYRHYVTGWIKLFSEQGIDGLKHKTTHPNEKWTTDVSQFNCLFEKAYLSPILDMHSGDIVAWDLSIHPNFEQTTRMLNKAFRKYKKLDGLIMHSDMGSQYQHRLIKKCLNIMVLFNRCPEKAIVMTTV